ncbi:TetR/AcrR family transcriptional regulator [Aquincola sp. S2]|uniref:TetR/AcrR family transcriptional regulator n=1 Tax=Pseudaquabacterium terrae TaxID=2732868 RepID=A0ABX2EQ75_9BURK|nr:TetR/AcrR family transcriptional regulator [Aquabacterium terrae]NRF70690.1 TetR/AcrR family transcriptional regulator [Aquabacterium terrae]
MARVRSAGYDDQRELILAQAAALFARQGYTATSMNEVAAACGISKPTLYHYVRDKHELLLRVAEAHIARLEALVADVAATALPPRERLAALITRFVMAYADAQHEHRVLTEDVKFLDGEARERVLGGERRVVAAFAQAVRALRPELGDAALATPLTMLLFGMINWMFTWLKPDGAHSHAAMAPVVVDLFLGGLAAVQPPPEAAARQRAESRRSTMTKKETLP